MPRVTVFGSLHCDIVVSAPSRPRKGETVAGDSWVRKFGGKGGNQAVAAAAAGAKVEMIGAVGKDEFADMLLARLDQAGVGRKFVSVVPGAGSGMSVAILDAEGDYGAVIVSGANLRLGPANAADATSILEKTDVLILQNEIPDAANAAAAAAVRAAGGVVILNAAPARILSPALTAQIDLLVVNAIEAEMLGGTPAVDTLAGALDAARHLSRTYGLVIVTAGGDGVAACDAHGKETSIPAETVDVVSTHGAGDVFVGTFAAAWARSEPLEACLRAANRAAGHHVSTPEAHRV